MASKLGLQSTDRSDATAALGQLAGVGSATAAEAASVLRDEYNILEWDEAFKEFTIVGDAVPRTQFLAFLRQRVASAYDETGKARLFASKAGRWCELLSDVECDFAEAHRITTREWRFRAALSNHEQLAAQIKLATDQWRTSFGVDDPRGTVIYCYVERTRDIDELTAETGRALRAAARESGVPAVPMMVVLLFDADGHLGQALAEMAVLDEGLTAEDRARFGNLIGAHEEKLRQTIRDNVETRLKERRYVTGLREAIEARRLDRACSEIFSLVYKTPIPFCFDGFTTARGNAADTCQELTSELLAGRLDYDGVMAKPVKTRNRAISVLKDSWGIFARDGSVSRRPSERLLKSITEQWDERLNTDEKRLRLGEAVAELCHPPYGGNIASVGLLLGVFVAPRAESLVVVRDGGQIALSQWIQDGLFRGKYIDLAALHEVELVYLGETPSEWQTLLDEWEQAQSHLDRKSGLDRALALKARLAVPPAVAYRVLMLEQQAAVSVRSLASLEKELDDSIDKMEGGILKDDVSNASWGACELKRIQDRMAGEGKLWTTAQQEEHKTRYEQGRQWIIQSLPEWLQRQVPRGDSPGAVGDFEHKMVRLLGANLKRLGLDSQFQQVQTYTLKVMRKAQTVADATQLVRDVDSWMTAHRDALRSARMLQIRTLRDAGKDYGAKLRGMSERIGLPQLSAVRAQLSEFLVALKDGEAALMKRTELLWQSKLRSEDDIARLVPEVESLVTVFDGLPDDQEDLLAMRRALRVYQRAYQQLADDHLTWPEFERLAEQLRAEATTALAESEPPWAPDETLGTIVDSVAKTRKDSSQAWIELLEAETGEVGPLAVAEVNRLHSRASNPPPVLAPAHEKRAAKVVKSLEKRLGELEIEWLIEKFKALPAPLRKKCLKLLEDAA